MNCIYKLQPHLLRRTSQTEFQPLMLGQFIYIHTDFIMSEITHELNKKLNLDSNYPNPLKQAYSKNKVVMMKLNNTVNGFLRTLKML